MEEETPDEVEYVQTKDGRPYPKKIELHWWLKVVPEIVASSSHLKCSVPDVLTERGILDRDRRWRLCRRAEAMSCGLAEAESDWHDSVKNAKS